jgi:hypothetical protein
LGTVGDGWRRLETVGKGWGRGTVGDGSGWDAAKIGIYTVLFFESKGYIYLKNILYRLSSNDILCA